MKQMGIILLLVCAATATANQGFDRNSLINPSKTVSLGTGGLLDPTRFSVSHSYSMSYSSGTTSQSWDGLYLSTLQYRFSVPVTLSLDVGMSHQPGALFKVGPLNKQAENSTMVMPRLELRYMPTKNTLIRVQYLNGRGLSNSSSPYYHSFEQDNLLLTPQR